MNFKNFLQTIFSIRNIYEHKLITILGIRIKVRTKKKYINNGFLTYDEGRALGVDSRIHLKEESFDYVPLKADTLSYTTFQMLNKVKELELKNKIKNGHKVRVAFLLDTISKFPGANVYKLMKDSPLFEPFVVLYNTYEAQFTQDGFWNDYKKEFNEIKQKEYNVYPGYDENRKYIPLENYSPDIVFISAAYFDSMYLHLSTVHLQTNYLVCFINYCFNTSNFYHYHYNNITINTSWKYFVETREDYTELMRFSVACGVNTVLTGYPKLDTYAKPLNECKLPDKINNGKPIVIYAPHWTINHVRETGDIGTFHFYHDVFLSMVKKYRNINFVFKPHPSLEYSLIDKNIMTSEEYQNYIHEWDSQPNGMYIFDGEYIDLFRKSDLMITDSGSFILEWLPTEHPCMYLVNPRRNPKTYLDGFSTTARKALEKYYLCYNKKDIEKYFSLLMFDKQDPMKDERIKLKDEIFINIGSAGQKIVDYLTTLLTN